MAKRILIGDGEIVVSKPGFDATSPSLADVNKVFDSDWGYNACLLFSGKVQLSSSWYDNGANANPTTINFPVTLNYAPAAMVWVTVDEDIEARAHPTIPCGGTIHNDRIVVDAIPHGLSGTALMPVDWIRNGWASLFYMVFAL